MIFKTLKPHSLALFASFMAILLSACGSSGGSSSANSDASGSVGVLLTDMPADPEQFAEINITIESIELLGGSESKQSIYSGPSETINLLDLKNESIPFAFENDIPVGQYCKIRLTLSQLELVLADETPEDLEDNERAYPKLPGNNKLDLNVRNCFEVAANQPLMLQLDIDAGRSIHVVENKKGFQFRPVVFVDAINTEFAPKLTRLNGILEDVNQETGTLLLCDALPSTGLFSRGCIEVNLTPDSAFFDNLIYNGDARAIDELFAPALLDTRLEVVGWPKLPAPATIELDLPETAIPETGLCAIWDPLLAIEEQAAAGECAVLLSEISTEQYLINDQGKAYAPLRPNLMIDALVLEAGTFERASGKALADADNSGVFIKTDSVSPISSNSLLLSFQESSESVNGTRFVSKEGVLLDSTGILDGLSLQADGVLELVSETESYLNTALVIVDLQTSSQDSISGVISTINGNEVSLSVDNEEVCDVSLSQYTFDASESFDLLTVSISGTSSTVSAGGSFETGQQVGISGTCSNFILSPTSIVIIDDQRP